MNEQLAKIKKKKKPDQHLAPRTTKQWQHFLYAVVKRCRFLPWIIRADDFP